MRKHLTDERRAGKLFTAWLMLILFLCVGLQNSRGQTALPPTGLPAPTTHVNDFAGVMSEATKARMEEVLRELKKRADIEFGVVIVKKTDGRTAFDYSLAIMREWGIGSADGKRVGLLYFVAVEDKQYFIQVSRHLEGDMPDGAVGEIGRRMREPFKARRYDEAFVVVVDGLIERMAEKRGFSAEGLTVRGTGTVTSSATPPSPPQRAEPPSAQETNSEASSKVGRTLGILFVLGIFGLIIVYIGRTISRTRRRRLEVDELEKEPSIRPVVTTKSRRVDWGESLGSKRSQRRAIPTAPVRSRHGSHAEPDSKKRRGSSYKSEDDSSTRYRPSVEVSRPIQSNDDDDNSSSIFTSNEPSFDVSVPDTPFSNDGGDGGGGGAGGGLE